LLAFTTDGRLFRAIMRNKSIILLLPDAEVHGE
jgi:hypothetical protein